MWLVFSIRVGLRWFSQCLRDDIFLKSDFSLPHILLNLLNVHKDCYHLHCLKAINTLVSWSNKPILQLQN